MVYLRVREVNDDVEELADAQIGEGLVHKQLQTRMPLSELRAPARAQGMRVRPSANSA